MKLGGPPPIINRYPEVDFLLSGLFPHLASQNPARLKQPVLYLSARDMFTSRYLRRCLAAVMWSLDGLLIARANWLTA